ncbi:YciI family protein [Neobacillus drentensis]|uniref:YciI family protein n=1 Tax=Neobacillus TaxID=2675232 RepID=UPI0027E0B857|nr:YciI family protein [Neobacillus sp. PS2-9]WML56177.1 YciI family protein [Neobacillus sp. PS2-9]
MEEFVYVIRPKREHFIETMTDEENAIMGKHFDYLKDLLAQEKLILAGPCLDGAMGICILRSESWDAAQKIMENDPAVVEGVMNCELHKYRVSLMEGRK